MQRLFSRTYHLVEVPALFKGKTGKRSRDEIFSRFANGEVLGITPELAASRRVSNGHPRAGYLLNSLAREFPKGRLQPIYAYNRGSHLFLNVGDWLALEEVGGEDNQETADLVMDIIKELGSGVGNREYE